MAQQSPSEMLPSRRVANELRAELARRRWSGRRLAAESGLALRSVSRRLAGDSSLTVDELVHLAQTLQVDAVDLLRKALDDDACTQAKAS